MKGERDYLGHRERIRSRFLKNGLDGFADYEVIELMLNWLVPRRDVKPIAKQLMREFGSLRDVLDASVDELREVEGIGPQSACGIKVQRAIVEHYLQQRSMDEPVDTDMRALKEYCRAKLGSEEIEVFLVFYLDSSRKIIGEDELERGTIDRAAVYPREVIQAAMRKGAVSIILAHNHPGGKLEPSDHDKTMTRAIELAGDPLQIRVDDHLIVSADVVFSFRESGLL